MVMIMVMTKTVMTLNCGHVRLSNQTGHTASLSSKQTEDSDTITCKQTLRLFYETHTVSSEGTMKTLLTQLLEQRHIIGRGADMFASRDIHIPRRYPSV